MALTLGCPSVDTMLAEMSDDELAHWMAYYQLEPFGGTMGFLQAGVISSTIANVNRGKKTKAFTPGDFIPVFDERDDEIQKVNRWVAMLKQTWGDGKSK